MFLHKQVVMDVVDGNYYTIAQMKVKDDGELVAIAARNDNICQLDPNLLVGIPELTEQEIINFR